MSSDRGDDAGEQRGVLFADLADSSRLYRELGDERAREVVLAALALGRGLVEERAGRVVDRIGDELFCLLPDGDAALRAALAIQERTEAEVEARRFPAGLAFRIGFVHGPVLLRGAEVFGDTVYLAKRVASLAKAEQVLTTGDTLAALADPDPERFLVVDRLRLKGRVDEVELVEALWGTAFTAPVAGVPAPPGEERARELLLRHGSEALVVSRERPVVTLGRSVACELVVTGADVSRRHARVELGREGFLLVDQSRNGTVVLCRGDEPRTVLRASAVLEGTGALRLGPHAGAPHVSFEVREAEG